MTRFYPHIHGSMKLTIVYERAGHVGIETFLISKSNLKSTVASIAVPVCFLLGKGGGGGRKVALKDLSFEFYVDF